MAVPTNTLQTYQAIGNREDLANAIYDVSPTETPFLSGIAKTSAKSTNHEWQTDALAAASAVNIAVEGDDATASATTATVRLGNYTQISTKTAQVSGTQSAVDTAGRADEMAYQIMKRSKELKRDVESSLLANNAKVAGNASTGRECAGIESWLKTNFGAMGTGTAPSTADGLAVNTVGTLVAVTEAKLKTVLASCYTNGGNPDTIMVGAFVKQAMSAFVGNASVVRDVGKPKTLVNAIDVYSSDFGDLAIIPNRFQVQTSALILEMDMWCMATLRDFQPNQLAITGDSNSKQILVEYTLEAKNEKSSGIIVGCAVS
jgi:hypothetical protein